MRPSIQRLSEYTQAASASPLAEEKIDGVKAMLANILRSEEEDLKLTSADPALSRKAGSRYAGKGPLNCLETGPPLMN